MELDIVGKVTFSISYEDGQSVVHTIRGDSSLDEVVEAFEYFLKGAGYHLREGQHIGYEYEDEDPEIHPIGDLSDTDEYTDYKAMANEINLSEVTFGAGDYSTVGTLHYPDDAWDNITVNSAIDGVDATDSITINLSDYTPNKSEK
jgi:hypothetical protein